MSYKTKITELKEKLKNNEAEIVKLQNDSNNISSNIDEINKQNYELRKEMVGIYTEHLDKLEKNVNYLISKFSLDLTVLVDVSEEIKDITGEFSSLSDDANEILGYINQYKIDIENLNIDKVWQKIKKVRSDIKELKRLQIKNYNDKVQILNNKIADLKGMTNLSSEIQDIISQFPDGFSKCDVVIRQYNQNSYMKLLDYKGIDELFKKISEVEQKLGVSDEKEMLNNLTAKIENIENNVSELLGKEVLSMSDEEINEVVEEKNNIINDINNLEIAVNLVKNKLSEEEYNNLVNRINDNKEKVVAFNVSKKENDYDGMKKSVSDFSQEVNNYNNVVNGFIDVNVTDGIVSTILDKYQVFEKKSANIRNEIEESYKNQLLDDSQYNNLMSELDKVDNVIKNGQEEVKTFNVMKSDDLFGLLDGSIIGLEQAVVQLDERIDKLDKPIKRETRKVIDLIIKQLEKEYLELSRQVEYYKEKDESKYNENKERLENCQIRLDEINKKYRKKCPFLVRTVKSAKNFYKKHKKLVLIVAGLASIALLHATVGPVIIPAIMHGNLMLMNKIPALAPLFGGVNDLLGGAINASIVKQTVDGITFNAWQLANGAVINPSCASASLLKGLAISGVGSAALITPAVIGIKKLVQKMKEKELLKSIKNKFSAGKEKVKDKFVTIKEKIKDKKENISSEITKNGDNSKVRKGILKELKKTIIEYQISGLSVEEFCEVNGMSEDEKNMLIPLIKKYEEELANRKGAKK